LEEILDLDTFVYEIGPLLAGSHLVDQTGLIEVTQNLGEASHDLGAPRFGKVLDQLAHAAGLDL
jgi:hypothetical protein